VSGVFQRIVVLEYPKVFGGFDVITIKKLFNSSCSIRRIMGWWTCFQETFYTLGITYRDIVRALVISHLTSLILGIVQVALEIIFKLGTKGLSMLFDQFT
jgi:hypothetical protein